MKKELKNIQTFEQHSDKNLNISDVISSETIHMILNDIDELRKIGSFIAFEHGDVMENMDRDDLKESAERFYEVLRKVEDRLTCGEQFNYL